MNKSALSFQRWHDASTEAIRDGFGVGLLAAGRKFWNVAVVSADLQESLRLTEFAQEFPQRFFEVGVAEQNLIGVSAGLAKEGLIPFAASFAAFSPGRNYDQIRVSVCYSNNNVKIVGGHAGLTVGEDGATHQMLEDVAMMRALPNMTVLVPNDFSSAKALTLYAAQLNTPVYLRLSRAKTKNISHEVEFIPGRLQKLRDGNSATIIANGVMVDRALQLAEDLSSLGAEVRVLNAHTIKPFDIEGLFSAAHETRAIITIEEHQVHGGLGSTVAELLSQHIPTPLEIIGVNDTFGESGNADALLDKYGFAREKLLIRVRQFLARNHVL